jgi:BolA protein
VSNDRQSRLQAVLQGHFHPDELLVKDQSHLHAGHEGAKDGKGHFDVLIVSELFDGVNRVQRHRMVYDAVSQMLDTDIHALRIKAYTPSER